MEELFVTNISSPASFLIVPIGHSSSTNTPSIKYSSFGPEYRIIAVCQSVDWSLSIGTLNSKGSFLWVKNSLNTSN